MALKPCEPIPFQFYPYLLMNYGCLQRQTDTNKQTKNKSFHELFLYPPGLS